MKDTSVFDQLGNPKNSAAQFLVKPDTLMVDKLRQHP